MVSAVIVIMETDVRSLHILAVAWALLSGMVP